MKKNIVNVKEQIREKFLNKNGLAVTKNPLGEKIKKAAYDAMDEYAKKVSTEFIEWMDKSVYSGAKWVDGYWIGDNKYTSEELFDIFHKEKNK